MIAIIGVGSPFGFDRLGWEAIDLLRERARAAPAPWSDVRLVQNDRLGAPLLAQIRGAAVAILIDALKTGADYATSPIRLELDALGTLEGGLSSHGFGLAETLALGRALHQLPPRVVVMGMEAEGRAERAPTVLQISRLSDAVEKEIEESRRALQR